jgi:hypothetical protein
MCIEYNDPEPDPIERARLQYAVPAQQKTEQARETTKQIAAQNRHATVRFIIGIAVVLAGAWVAVLLTPP